MDVPTLDSVPIIAFNRLKNQSSFTYKYQFKSDLPHNVSGDFRGRVVLPNQEEREGTLAWGRKKNKLKIKARNNYQYERSRGSKKWKIIPRGEETNIMLTIERTITNAKFVFVNENKNTYIYQFVPNLSFLDPTFTRKITASLIIYKESLLPQKITAQDSSQKIHWQLEFFDYNKVKSLKFPFLPTTQITLASEKKINKSEIETTSEVLERRLDIAGENYKLTSKSNKNATLYIIELELPQQNPDYKLLQNLLTNSGVLSIYPVDGAAPILNNFDFSEVLIKSFKPYPTISFVLNQSGINKLNNYSDLLSGRLLYKIFIDTILLGEFSIDKPNFSDRIDIQVITSNNEIMNIMEIIKSGMLATPLKLYSIEEIK